MRRGRPSGWPARRQDARCQAGVFSPCAIRDADMSEPIDGGLDKHTSLKSLASTWLICYHDVTSCGALRGGTWRVHEQSHCLLRETEQNQRWAASDGVWFWGDRRPLAAHPSGMAIRRTKPRPRLRRTPAHGSAPVRSGQQLSSISQVNFSHMAQGCLSAAKSTQDSRSYPPTPRVCEERRRRSCRGRLPFGGRRSQSMSSRQSTRCDVSPQSRPIFSGRENSWRPTRRRQQSAMRTQK